MTWYLAPGYSSRGGRVIHTHLSPEDKVRQESRYDVFGSATKNMGFGPRPTWSDPKIPDWNPATKKDVDGQLATA
jgi:hypothetical protein